MSGDWTRVGWGVGAVVLASFLAYVAHVSDRARRQPGTPWGRGDTAVVVAGSVIAAAALGTAVVSIFR